MQKYIKYAKVYRIGIDFMYTYTEVSFSYIG